MSADQDVSVPINRLLAALPTEVYQRLLPHLKRVSLVLEQVLYEIDESVLHVYFPQHSVISLVAPTSDGSLLEIGLVEQEGMAGILAILGNKTRAHRAIVQIAGSAMRMDAAVLRAEFERGGPLQRLLLRYVQALFTQASQCAVCNRYHTTEERLARWLLLVQNCLQNSEFSLTQETIGKMLGIRRSSVTVAAGNLSQAGLIHYTRGRITVLDRSALEEFACECYGVIQSEFAHLLGSEAA